MLVYFECFTIVLLGKLLGQRIKRNKFQLSIKQYVGRIGIVKNRTKVSLRFFYCFLIQLALGNIGNHCQGAFVFTVVIKNRVGGNIGPNVLARFGNISYI